MVRKRRGDVLEREREREERERDRDRDREAVMFPVVTVMRERGGVTMK